MIRPALALLLASAAPAAAQEASPFVTERGAATLLGSKMPTLAVVGPDGAALGDVSDTILGPDGRIRALVVGVGGVLGLGERPVAIRWEHLAVRETADGFEIVSALDRAALDAAPEYREREE